MLPPGRHAPRSWLSSAGRNQLLNLVTCSLNCSLWTATSNSVCIERLKITPGETTMSQTHTKPGREYPGMPRWVKVSGIIVIGLVLLVVVVLLVATALGLHTPGGP